MFGAFVFASAPLDSPGTPMNGNNSPSLPDQSVCLSVSLVGPIRPII